MNSVKRVFVVLAITILLMSNSYAAIVVKEVNLNRKSVDITLQNSGNQRVELSGTELKIKIADIPKIMHLHFSPVSDKKVVIHTDSFDRKTILLSMLIEEKQLLSAGETYVFTVTLLKENSISLPLTSYVLESEIETDQIESSNNGESLKVKKLLVSDKSAPSCVDVRGNIVVNGKIKTRELVITKSGPWPDYVFESEHKIIELDSLESFVKENKHLPGIPSSREVEEHGQDIAKIQENLLKRVEELTLIVIQQSKEIKALKSTINKEESK